MKADKVIDLIEARRAELGLSMADVAEMALGSRKRTPIQDMKTGSSPSIKTMEALCNALGLEFYVGPPRLAAEDQVGAVQPFLRISIEGSTEALERGYAAIPYHKSEVQNMELPPVALGRAWLESKGLDAKSLTAVMAVDDRMNPVISKNSIVLLEREVPKDFDTPVLCALRESSRLLIGYLSKSGSSFVMTFEERATPPVVLPYSNHVHMQVIGPVRAVLSVR
ncbi:MULTISPECIES: helix-turn-helix transcriptional regulator [Roseobacteraceae]|uniref:helix-turn-helix domain-containing protein n=1 Tax=Roseobacteraceae TaxID=2854170 RepID=UPI002B27994C|nr:MULTISPECIES: helix-turn-helix transcriptional regulator [Roseobacteraceae]